MPITLGDLSAIMTPYTPPGTGSASYSRALASARRGTEKFAARAAGKRAAAERAQKFQLDQQKAQETARHHKANESYNRNMLGESKRAALARERHASDDLDFNRTKHLSDVQQLAQGLFDKGDVDGACALLSTAGASCSSKSEVAAALDGLGKVVAEGKGKQAMEQGLTQLPEEAPVAQLLEATSGVPGMGGTLQAMGATPEQMVAQGESPNVLMAPPQAAQQGQAPPLPGDPGLAAPAYDPSQVPVGGAPEGMSREQYLAAEQAQEPAFAQQPALPALPGQDMGALGAAVEEATRDAAETMAAVEHDSIVEVTLPGGRRYQVNPAAKQAREKAGYYNHFKDYADGSSPEMQAANDQLLDTSMNVLAAFGGDEKKAMKHMLDLLKLQTGVVTQGMRSDAAMAMHDAKRAQNNGQTFEEMRMSASFNRQAFSFAKSTGHHANEAQIKDLDKALTLLNSGDGMQLGNAIGAMTKAMYGGHASDRDMQMAKTGIMSAVDKLKTFSAEIASGTLDQKHINGLIATVMTTKKTAFKIRERIRGEFDAMIDSAAYELEANAWRRVQGVLFAGTQDRRTPKDLQRIQAAEVNKRIGLPPPRLDDEVAQEAEIIRERDGDEAAAEYYKDAGVEDADAVMDGLMGGF